MQVHANDRSHAEQFGRAVLLVATDDLAVSEYLLEPGAEPVDTHYHAKHTDCAGGLPAELNALRSRGEKPGADSLRSHDIYDI